MKYSKILCLGLALFLSANLETQATGECVPCPDAKDIQLKFWHTLSRYDAKAPGDWVGATVGAATEGLKIKSGVLYPVDRWISHEGNPVCEYKTNQTTGHSRVLVQLNNSNYTCSSTKCGWKGAFSCSTTPEAPSE